MQSLRDEYETIKDTSCRDGTAQTCNATRRTLKIFTNQVLRRSKSGSKNVGARMLCRTKCRKCRAMLTLRALGKEALSIEQCEIDGIIDEVEECNREKYATKDVEEIGCTSNFEDEVSH